MIRVLVADDSAFMRRVLTDLFQKQQDFEVVGIARNGKEAVEQVLKLKPDVVTMDVNMPIMDGISALEVIMKDCPVPVIMFSSLTKEGAEETIKALEIGAVDFISKTGGSVSSITLVEDEILSKCRAAAKANIKRIPKRFIQIKKSEPKISEEARPVGVLGKAVTQRIHGVGFARPSLLPPFDPQIVKPLGKKLVVLGTSTGGPKALQTVIRQLPKNLPAGVLIVQHMPAGFTKSLAERLNEISEIFVKEAENNDMIEEGKVYIAPGNYHMVIERIRGERRILLNQEPPIGTLRPAADYLFDSAVPFGNDIVSVILTGMGCDGAAGMKKIKQAGGYVISEDESTSIVYGMPRAVVELGIADKVLPLPMIAKAIVEAVRS